jgi:uncharacterized membrane protein YvlD (DUF360 family)
MLLWLTDKLVDSFEIGSLRSLLVSSAAITVVSGICRSQWAAHAWNTAGRSGWM